MHELFASALFLFFLESPQAYLFSVLDTLNVSQWRRQARRCLQSQIKREARFSQRSSIGLGKEMDAMLPDMLTRYESFRPEIDDEVCSFNLAMCRSMPCSRDG